MNRKRIAAILAGLLLLIIAGCGAAETGIPPSTSTTAATAASVAAETEPADTQEQAATQPGEYKIGVLTGPESLEGNNQIAVKRLALQYGDRIVSATYPATYPDNESIVISCAMNLAADPAVKVIVIPQAIPGTVAAIEKIREIRDDILFLCGNPWESTKDIAENADIVLDIDREAVAEAVVRYTVKTGAEAFVCYSYPRQLAVPSIAVLQDTLISLLEKEGIAFYEVTTPDPVDAYGPEAVAAFIMDDIKQQVEQHGENTAFFGTDCGMQAPLVLQTLDSGGIFPGQCCPSPSLGYDDALGYTVPSARWNESVYLSELLQSALSLGRVGEPEPEDSADDTPNRFGAWSIDLNTLILESFTAYGIAYCDGLTAGGNDDEILRQVIGETAGDARVFVQQYGSGTEPSENYYLLLTDHASYR